MATTHDEDDFKSRGGRPRLIVDPVSETFSLPRAMKNRIQKEAVRLGFKSRACLWREICLWWFDTQEDWEHYWNEETRDAQE